MSLIGLKIWYLIRLDQSTDNAQEVKNWYVGLDVVDIILQHIFYVLLAADRSAEIAYSDVALPSSLVIVFFAGSW